MFKDTSAKIKRRAQIDEPSPPLMETMGDDLGDEHVVVRKWPAKQIAVVLLCLLALYSPAVMLYKVHSNAVDVPFWDEWDFVDTFRAVSEGETSVSQFLLSSAGEHKIAGQILLSIAGWYATGMHEPITMTFNWLLGVVFCVLAALITRRFSSDSLVPWIALAATSFLLFNPAAYQPWLWAIPTVYLLIPLLFFMGVAIVQSKWRLSIRIAVCGALALAGSFMLGSGVLLWILLPAVWLLYEGKTAILSSRAGLGVYVAFFVLTALGFIASASSMHRTAPAEPATPLTSLAAFFFAYTGNFISLSAEALPLSQAQFLGFALVLFFVLIALLAARVYRHTANFQIVAVWILLGMYSVVAGLLITWARVGFGVNYPLEASRYVIASCFLPLTCIVLATMLLVHYVGQLKEHLVAYSVVLACTAILIATVISVRFMQTPRAHALMTHSYFHQLRGKVAIAAVNYIPLPTYRGIYPKDDFATFARSVRFLNARGWLHPGIWDTAFFTEAAGKPVNASYGNLEKAVTAGDKVSLTGWAYLADRQERPHAIFALAIKGGVAPRLIGVTFPSGTRQDTYARFQNFEALSTGWSIDVPRAELADPLSRIICLAYEANSGTAHRFPGEVSGEQLRR